ncbi:MAG: Gfo/Idh/MocA family oxidoreductase [Elusimicrobiota bacterium]
MRGALIGFGQVAQNAHAPAFKRVPGLAIVAAADPSAERRAAAEREIEGLRAYPSAEALYDAEKGLDFVDVATPPYAHARDIAAGLERGCHVLCEKPLTFTMREFEGVSRLARKRGRALFPIHNWKYAPILQKLRALVAAGEIGPVRHLEWHVLRTRPAAVAGTPAADGNWRTSRELSGGGILMDHGWHAFYLAGWLVGRAPLSVSGILKSPPGGDTETEATCLIEYPRTSALIHLSWNAPRRGHWGVLHGPEGRIEIFDDRLLLARGTRSPQVFAFPEPLSHGSAHPEWLHAMLGDFLAAVRRPSRGPGAAALEEARQCRWLLDRLYRRRRAGAKTDSRSRGRGRKR